MSGTTLSALARLAERRFPSFSEAADSVLDALEAELPAGSVLLGQVDWDEGEYRLIDIRGEAAERIHPGDTLALAATARGEGLLDPDMLAALSVRSYLAVPLETSAGGGAITLCALASGTDLYNRTHLELLAVAGRLLTYEWETVKWRADLRRMGERLRDPERTDPLTGLLNRAAFADGARERVARRRGRRRRVLPRGLPLPERRAAGGAARRAHVRAAAEGRRGDDGGGDPPLRPRRAAWRGPATARCSSAARAARAPRRSSSASRRGSSAATRERPATLDIAHAVIALGEAGSADAALTAAEKETQ